jgi:hypothetical protein
MFGYSTEYPCIEVGPPLARVLPQNGLQVPDATQSMHVDLTCVCMCVGGLTNAVAIAPRPVPPASHIHIAPGL